MVQRHKLTRISSGISALVLVLGLTLQVFLTPQQAYAATQITNRSLTLVDGTTVGGSDPGGTVITCSVSRCTIIRITLVQYPSSTVRQLLQFRAVSGVTLQQA
jgi:hypothetical protein